jgi:hypothetical protein
MIGLIVPDLSDPFFGMCVAEKRYGIATIMRSNPPTRGSATSAAPSSATNDTSTPTKSSSTSHAHNRAQEVRKHL